MSLLGNAPSGYRGSQIALHWAVFILVAFLFVTGDNMSDAFWDRLKTGAPALNYPWIPIHILCGLAVLGAMIWRLALRRRYGAPRPPASEPAPLRIAAIGVHHLLYLWLILAPIVGLVGFFLIPKAADIHHLMVRLPLLILVGLHIAGALWHAVFTNDGVFQRMLRPQ